MGKIYNWQVLNNNLINTQEELLEGLLINRGFVNKQEQEEFLNTSYSLKDPFKMRGMKEAVDRILQAQNNNEKVIVYGDYDCDGVTSTTIIVKTLRKMNVKVDYFIPSRFKHGYGPNEEIFTKIVKSGYNLVISVDNGITGVEEAEVLKKADVDYIIVDHHEPQEEIPYDCAIVNPKVEGETYHFKDFCAAGLALKLAQALLSELPDELLEIAAVGTLADMVPLKDENRLIVVCGLEKLMNSQNRALSMIINNSKEKNINSDFIGFQISPLINTVGRVDDAQKAVMFLLEEDDVLVTKYYAWMKNLNGQRKKRTNESVHQAIKIIEEENVDDPIVMIYSDTFHQGLVGIIANRVMDYCNKPAFVFYHNKDKGTLVGSGRSQKGFNLFENVSLHKAYLEHFGGHAYAMGASLKEKNFAEFKSVMKKLASEQDVAFFLDVDMVLPLELCNLKTLENINNLEPFGQQNKKPVFLFEGLKVKKVSKLGDGTHLKIEVSNLENTTILAFGIAAKMREIKNDSIINVVGCLQKNNYDGTLNIVLSDFEINK